VDDERFQEVAKSKKNDKIRMFEADEDVFVQEKKVRE
jgi:hypothetical protein